MHVRENRRTCIFARFFASSIVITYTYMGVCVHACMYLLTYVRICARDEDKIRLLEEAERKRADAERRAKIAAAAEEEKKWREHQTAAAAEQKKREDEAAAASAAAEKQRQEQEASAAAAAKKRRKEELAAEANRAAHDAWAQGLATIEQAEQEGHKISSYNNHHVLEM